MKLIIKLIRHFDEIHQKCLRVKKEHGKGILSQIKEMVLLKMNRSSIGVGDYYYYRLYDDNLFSFEDKKQYLGWRHTLKSYDFFCDKLYEGIFTDKLYTHFILKETGFRIPEVYLIQYPEGRYAGSYTVTSDPDDTLEYLTKKIKYPFFCKALKGQQGASAMGVIAYDKDNKVFSLMNGKAKNLMEMKDYLKGQELIFEQMLYPHETISKLTHNRLFTIRAVSYIMNKKPYVFRTAIKIISGDNMADNWSEGRMGNLIGLVNRDNGRIERVLSKDGEVLNECSCHPDTGLNFSDFSIPAWKEVIDHIERATMTFPWLTLQHWDITVTSQGPVIIEGNSQGGFELTQLVGPPGTVDDEFLEFLSGFPEKFID